MTADGALWECDNATSESLSRFHGHAQNSISTWTVPSHLQAEALRYRKMIMRRANPELNAQDKDNAAWNDSARR